MPTPLTLRPNPGTPRSLAPAGGHHPIAPIPMALALLALAGCASGPPGDSASERPATGDALVDGLAASYAQDMDALGQPTGSPTRGTPRASGSGVFIERVEPTDPDPGADAGTPPAVASGSTDPNPGAPSVDPAGSGASDDPRSDVTRLARELAGALRARAMTGSLPYEDLSRVAMLEAIAPGVLEGLGEDSQSDSSDLVALLAPSERDALRAARRTARALAASESSDPSLAADALLAAAAQLEESQSVRIRNALLCRRVDGFARYEAFGSTAFLAGRVNPVIVYAEVERFRQEPVGSSTPPATAQSGAATPAATSISTQGAAPPGSRFAVRLTQSLNLYFSDGGLLVWRRPPQTVTDFSADRFRDFYTIDRIDLPSTLAAGAYSLKIVIRDEATGEQAERIIPITLVAEAGLAQGG